MPPRPYPQLLRGERHRWWRPLLGLFVAVGCALVLLAGSVVVAAAVTLITGGDGTPRAGEAPVTPADLLVTNLVLAALVPLSMLAVLLGHGWRPRWLASVTGRLRWGWLWRCVGLALAVQVLFVLLLVALGGADGLAGATPEPQAALLLLVVALTTPLQAAGEEYAFRGWLSQGIGSLFARPVLAGLVAGAVSAALFALAHGSQDVWLFADRFAFGVTASWLAWRTGGLEAPIALHAVNNVVAFVPTILLGGLEDALTATGSSPAVTAVDVVQMTAVALLVDRAARRTHLTRRFVDPRI